MQPQLRRGPRTGVHDQLESQRSEWLRMLEFPRGRDEALMCLARWHPEEQLAAVERVRGNDMHVFGVYKQGQLWLSADETLCLVEDGLLQLWLGEAPLSVQAATHELLGRGGASAVRTYAVFAHLHRHGFVSRPAPLEQGGSVPLLEVRHRRGYSRRAVEAGSQPPLFVAAVFDAAARMPTARELQALAVRCAPVPLRCACAHEHEVLFFEVGAGDLARPAAAAAAAPEASPSHRLEQPLAPAASPPLQPPPSPPPPSPPPSPPPHPGGGGVIIDGEDDEEDDDDAAPDIYNAPPPPATAAAPPPAAPSTLIVEGEDDEDNEGATPPPASKGDKLAAPPREPLPSACGGGGGGLSVPAASLAFATPPVTGAAPVGAAAAPSRAQRRLHELQQTAAQSLLRAVRMHTQAAHEQLDATDRAATHATGMARQGAEQMQSAISQIRGLTAELRAMREGTCLESLPPPRFGI